MLGKILKSIGMLSILMVSVMFVFSGCDEKKRYPGVDGRGPSQMERVTDNTSDFSLIKKQTFYDEDAYGKTRSIYIIKDKVTGKEYIGVSGIGISERGSHTFGKSKLSDER